MNQNVQKANIDLGVVAMVLAGLSWLFGAPTLTWIGFYLVFGVQWIIVLFFISVKSWKVKIRNNMTIAEDQPTWLKSYVMSVLLIVAWYVTGIPGVVAVMPIVLGVLIKLAYKRNVLPSL